MQLRIDSTGPTNAERLDGTDPDSSEGQETGCGPRESLFDSIAIQCYAVLRRDLLLE